MTFNFELLLVILTLVTGVIWAWDKWLRPDEPDWVTEAEKAEGKTPPEPWWLDLSRSLFPVILAVLVIRSFVVEPFRIPSGSMVPTLLTGDFILVNKFSYGIRLPVIYTKLVPVGEPQRGDVAVFRYPENPAQDYIKRVIGLPGDRISYRNKQLFVNGEPIPQVNLGPYVGPEGGPGALLHKEEVAGDSYTILIHPQLAFWQDYDYRVPEGTYYVLGDNRDQSSDSRSWGPVPEENLVGRAFIVWMSWDPARNRINWSRIGDRIN
ncbi:signal peptidase I [Alkalilimnicola ehrlichii]|uniref:Signal peptidase I n=1 Tax=Alkalilimnicola ehrlichii TaxID=351052 RepID=A0A3E0WZS1_9GAMM|nr:signal peptidase I [Alkalilimnicola ehrlichii]RFA28349.1 signal peptidase I [Alkalilimnicola ehrlichii]RFA38587.1 signal peptidase I [Alkalilimnicola ehrlichii]